MKKLYFCICVSLIFFSLIPLISQAQDCLFLTATFKAYESRCAATGSIKVSASGGSGSYKYKTFGPVNSNFTTSDSITGLSAGTYSVLITDIVSNCTFTQTGIIVTGSYQDPRFALSAIDVSCDNGTNGSIIVSGQQFGRAPFTYSIVSPSSGSIGTTNSTGQFDNLAAGDYTIRMTDSCGGIQTRQIRMNGYTWQIDSYNFTKTACDSASGYIKVIDSKGNISTVGGIPGFTYGIVRQPGDTIWSSNPNFQFDLAGHTTFDVVVKDNCGEVKKAPAALVIVPVINAIVISSKSCNTFTATVTGINYFFSPAYCLYDGSNTLVTCNSTGVFSNLPYGNYCIGIHDSCTDTTITRCFTATPPPISVGNTVVTTDKICTSFTATITGQVGLTNPNYCLYDSSNTLITCNVTGIFTALPYGSYCIRVKDGCRDTTISVCFTATRPIPSVPDVIIPNYGTCTTFGIVVGGTNLFAPRYCLYDSLNVLISCNNTGIFDGLTFGSYCANVYDSCFDTTFVRCFTAGPPPIGNDIAVPISNKSCSTFTVSASSNNLKNPSYCLYNANDSLIACDSSGIFNNLPYGSYCIKAHNPCPDTILTKCFTVTQNIPSVNNTVKINSPTCTTFSAQITGQINLTSPNYCLYNSVGVQLSCNTTGQFSNLLYGKYCIKIVNTCYDTTIVECFTAAPQPVKITVNSNKSCSYNYAKFSISILSGALPFNVKIYAPDNSLFYLNNFTSTSINIDSIPGTTVGQTYKIVVTDNCGTKDSVSIGAVASYVNYFANPVAKCPSGTFMNGSGDIVTTASTNMGALTVRVIKKNNVSLLPQLAPNTVIGGVYTFQNLSPGTYILSYKANDVCYIYRYDTVVIQPYQYPTLGRSSAYQCDINGFSIGAVVSNGVGPFTYEIIGSTPSTPAIIAPPQTNPIFSINNGTTYSLVRLRAVDGCGNGTLADASILPLANNGIANIFNCYQIPTTLSIDAVYGATYAWYKKASDTSSDSVFLGSSVNYYIPIVLPADTGVYVCNLVVNGGCISRTYYYHLDATCYHILPLTLMEFGGTFIDDKVLLNWKIASMPNLQTFVIQRKTGFSDFTDIGRVNAGNAADISQYNFLDTRPEDRNFYRLKLISDNNSFTYSKTITLNRNSAFKNIQIYPNPVNNILNVDFKEIHGHTFKITLLSALSQVVKEITFTSGYNNNLQITRTNNMKSGIYILKIVDLNNNEEMSQKIIFR